MAWPRGKVLGGSSSINGLIYIRGQKQDFDFGASSACTGWSYDDVLPYFSKAEDQERGANEYHGAGGPLAVSDLRSKHELNDAFIAGAKEAGYPSNPDFNGAEQEGVGPLQLTVRGMRRCCAAVGYLRPAMKRPNLKVEIRALAQRVMFDGKRADRRGVRSGRRRPPCPRPRARSFSPAARSIRRSYCSSPASGPASCCRARHPGRARAARRRREPAGPYRLPHRL